MLTTVLLGCASHMGRQDLLRRMEEGDAPAIVDVRSRKEYREGHIPGAVHLPFSSISEGVDRLLETKSQPLVLYCEHGPRAGLARISLWLRGYRNVTYLEGHMKSWRRHGLPVTSEP